MQSTSISEGRGEAKRLIQWIKDLVYCPRIQKLEDLRNGVVWCRLMGKLRPGCLASVLIINRPANVSDSMHNYILLESAFAKAKVPWNFEARSMIAGDGDELLRIAKCFAELRVTPDPQSPSNNYQTRPDRKARYPAGEHEQSAQLWSSQPATELPSVESGDDVELEPDDTQLSSATANGRGAEDLKERIQIMFNKQQVAVEAFLAEERSRSCSCPPRNDTMCCCTKCHNQGETANSLLQCNPLFKKSNIIDPNIQIIP